MLRLAANISTLFTELPLLQRPSAASALGFSAVEMQFPYDVAPRDLAAAAERASVEFVLLNTPPGERSVGEFGLACLPGREEDFATALRQATETAGILGCRRIHALAGNRPGGESQQRCWDVLVRNLRLAARRLGDVGIQLLIEPLNPIEYPRYLVTRLREADELLDAVGHPNLALQYDVYHRHTAGEGSPTDLVARVDRVRHIQFSDFPGRHEPGSGEIDFAQLFAAIERSPYSGWTSAEYTPAGATGESFSWLGGIAGLGLSTAGWRVRAALWH